jgi:probable rRNA maturation factor
MTPATLGKQAWGKQTRAKLKIDVLVDSDRWKDPAKTRTAVRRAIGEAAATVSTTGTEVAIVLTDDSAVRQLNRLWRGIDAATNVLSFPARRKPADEPPHLGDIVLAYETIAREAGAEGKPFAHHLAHLAVHGFLHLIGYDHDKNADAETMEQTERKILRRLHIPDPYRPPGKVAKKAAGKR